MGRQPLAEHGVPDFTWTDHERYGGISTRETVARWKSLYGLRAPVPELLADKSRRCLEPARTATRVYPEMRKFVELLAGEGVPMAVASGSSPEAVDAILAGTGLHRAPVRRGPGRGPRVRPRRSAPAGRPGGVHGTGGP